MNDFNLEMEKGTIIGMEFTDMGKIYFVKTENRQIKIVTRNYDRVSEYISREFGSDLAYVKDKDIYLISDKDRLLALNNEKNSLMFVRDFIDENYETITNYGNIDYIKQRYNLSEEEFMKIVREDIQTKKLRLI